MAAALPLPAGHPLDATSWEQTPLVVRQVVVQLLAVIQQQHARIAALEARVSQNSRNSDRPPSSDPPFVTPSSSAPIQGTPGAKPGHPGHRQVLLTPTEVVEVMPDVCGCGQQEVPTTTAYYTHQVIELPEIQMTVTHVVLHEGHCPGCGRLLSATTVLNAKDAAGMRNGYRSALSNSPGGHWIDPSGQTERELASKYRNQAGELESEGYHRLANSLQELAASYERDAERLASSDGFDC